jgi:hypothetical protein
VRNLSGGYRATDIPTATYESPARFGTEIQAGKWTETWAQGGARDQTGGSPSQETHGTDNCKGYALSVPGFSRQAAPTRIAFHSNPAARCKGEALDAGKPPLACKKFLDENEKAAAESELERRFREFEAKFWGLRFKMRDYFMGEKSAGRM